MKNIKINKKFLKGYEYDSHDGSESFRMHNSTYMLKFIHSMYLKDDRIEIIKILNQFEHDNIVKPEFLISDKKKYLGYAMKYLSDYTYIDDLIYPYYPPTLDFNQRKKLMIKLSHIFDYFYSQNYAYYDVHGNNILIKNNKIKVIDLDGGIIKGYKNSNLDYNAAIRKSTKQLSRFILSFIYNMDSELFLDILISKKTRDLFLEVLPYYLKEFYQYAIDDNYKVFDNITDVINEIDETTYKETEEVLKKRLNI